MKSVRDESGFSPAVIVGYRPTLKDDELTSTSRVASTPTPEEAATFAEHMAQRDADRFVGRHDVLAAVGKLLEAESERSVLFVHGPAGIGKSALLRAAGRLAAARGYRVHRFDGRQVLESDPPEATSTESLLLLVDAYEMVPAVGAHLRDHLLPGLPAGTRVLVGSRNSPDAGWHTDGWEAVTEPVQLGPLSSEDSRLLLEKLGVSGEDAVTAILTWARGEPLALVAGAEAASAPTFDPTLVVNDSGLANTVAERLVGGALFPAEGVHGRHAEALAVAAIARAVDAPLLADVLDGVSGVEAEAWLRELPYAELLDGRITVHDRVRSAVQLRLRAEDAARHRELRRRLADHFVTRAYQGDIRFLAETGALFEDPDLRWAWAADGSGDFRIDRPRPGDEEEAGAALGASGTRWWAGVARWMREAPEHVAVLRDNTGRVAGLCSIVTTTWAPEWVHEDPVVGPQLAHAARHFPDGDVAVGRDLIEVRSRPGADRTAPMERGFQVTLSMLDRLDITICYGSVVVGDPEWERLVNTWRAEPVPGLVIVDGERTLAPHIVRFEGGVIETSRALVYHELGLAPPVPIVPPVSVETVREALRSVHNPHALASNPLAKGGGINERADSVRRLLESAAEGAFGTTKSEQLLRSTILLGYLDPDLTHENAARMLHLGRSTYFERLAEAVQRIAAHISASNRDVPRP